MQGSTSSTVGWRGFSILLLPFLIWEVIYASRPTIKAPVQAPPYVWSADCPEADYKQFNAIPSGCARSEYEVRNWRDYPHISNSARHLAFYRVGNDIDEIVCGWSRCQVNRTLRHAFKQ
jgi:hypothetical protein